MRFALGGLATVVAGLVADSWGPAAGGLFLAFPAIFCASATLIEKHERERKEKKGLQGKERGKDAAALDAAGAGLGSVALAVFGAVMWFLANEHGLRLPGSCSDRLACRGDPPLARAPHNAGLRSAISGTGCFSRIRPELENSGRHCLRFPWSVRSRRGVYDTRALRRPSFSAACLTLIPAAFAVQGK